jgi:hypothetical protein
MKNLLIWSAGIVLLTSLVFTKSIYVEGAELPIIVAFLTVGSIIYNKKHASKVIWSSAAIGFIFFWIFGVTDMVIDHYLYFLPSGNEDGAALTLGFKLEEYNDDLFAASLISMFVVVSMSFLMSKIFTVVSKENL